jgi:hypothetical protein
MKVVLCLAPALAIGTTAAAASTSTGVLTQPEYQQLATMFRRIDAVKGTSVRAVKTKESICRHTDGVTVLVSDEKASCLGFAEEQFATAAVVAVEKRCDAKATVSKQLNCLIPSYRLFYRSLETEYRVLERLKHLDKTRHFSSGCVAILGGAPKGVASYGRIARDAGQVLSDLRSHDTTRLRAAEDRLFAAENSTTGTTTAHYSLSACTQAL